MHPYSIHTYVLEACFKDQDSEVFSLVDATRLRIVSPTLLVSPS